MLYGLTDLCTCNLPVIMVNFFYCAFLLIVKYCTEEILFSETVSDLEECVSRSPQGSPVVKKRGHWGKVLMKTKREQKNPQSFQSLASVSMMMLPTITVAGSSASVTANLEDVMTVSRSGSLLKKNREVKSLSSSPQTSNNWLKSQSLLNVNCISDESDNSDRSTDNVARKYGLDTSLYDKTHLSKSSEAVNQAWKSMENFAGDIGFVDLPNGVVHFFASYNKHSRKLLIRIEKIEGLAPKGPDRSKYDCIVKLTILPHEKHIKYSKTIPAHSTLDLHESFIFSVKEPTKKVLRISVYDVEFQGKYDAVGHALLYIEDVLNNERKSHSMKLYRQSVPDIQAGSIKITLNYSKNTEFLNIFIEEAYNLPTYTGGKCKSYVKLTHHLLGKKIKEIYSPYVITAREVRYNFTVDLKIDSSSLQNSFVIISIKIKGFLKKDVLAGRVILGPFLYAEYGKSLTPWGRALINNEIVTHIFRMYL